MNVKTVSVALALTISFSNDALAILTEAAKRENVSVEELVKAHILSLCEGVNTPDSKLEVAEDPLKDVNFY